MASNGLVANASKTALMFLNSNRPKNDQGETNPISIMIGDIEVFSETSTELRTRSADANQLNEAYGGKILTSTFVSDAAKIWNNAPESIKQCKSLYAVRKLIKNHTLTLPI